MSSPCRAPIRRDGPAARLRGIPIKEGPLTERANQGVDRVEAEPLYDYLLPNYGRRLLHTRWCRRWWQHAEAIRRLEAIWQACEVMRATTGQPGWRCGGAIFRPAPARPHRPGPFFDCDAAKDLHKIPATLPVEEPPVGLFRAAGHPEERPHAGP